MTIIARNRHRKALLVFVVTLVMLAADAAIARAGGRCGASGRVAARTATSDAIEVFDAHGGGPRVIDTGSWSLWQGRYLTGPSWSNDGRVAYGYKTWLALVSDHSELRVASPNGQRRTIATLSGGDITEVAWSPAGNRIAFLFLVRNYPVEWATWSQLADHTVLFVVDADGRRLRPVVTDNALIADSLNWSPDGRRLAYVDGTLGRVQAVDVDALVPAPQSLTPPTLRASAPVWSPDGRRVAFLAAPVASPFDMPTVRVVTVDGLGVRDLRIRSGYPPSWSPDSRLLAVSAARGLEVVAVDGSQRRQLTAGSDSRPSWSDSWPSWSPHDNRVAFVRRGPDRTSSSAEIWTVDTASGRARPISPPRAHGYLHLVWCR